MSIVSKSKKDAYALLDRLNAPEHLVAHVRLVDEAAEQLIAKCEELKLSLDYEFIRVGVAIHDIGKVLHSNEVVGPGSKHEPDGEQMLLDEGVSPRLARVCMSHARWREMDCSTEELLIALSDKLWKGKRVEDLELEVIDRIATLLNTKRWDVFADMDLRFEEIASGGHERLQRSVAYS